jgi:hypothetical protein
MTLDSLGALAETRGELGRATVRYREALLMAQEISDPLTVSMALRALAGLAAKSGHFVSAARIWGAGHRLVEVIGAPLPTEEQARYEGTIASAREQLGEESFAAAFEEGRALPLDAAVSEALALADKIMCDAKLASDPSFRTSGVSDGQSC